MKDIFESADWVREAEAKKPEPEVVLNITTVEGELSQRPILMPEHGWLLDAWTRPITGPGEADADESPSRLARFLLAATEQVKGKSGG